MAESELGRVLRAMAHDVEERDGAAADGGYGKAYEQQQCGYGAAGSSRPRSVLSRSVTAAPPVSSPRDASIGL